MGTTAQKLQIIIDSKAAISAAIEAKGGTVPQELSGYGPAISALPSGGPSPEQLTYVLYEDNTISSYLLEGSISGETTTTPYPAFQNGKVVQLGNAVTEIGTAAFGKISSLIATSIPDSVTSIGNSAFSDCSGLTSVTIPDSVTSIGYSVFYGCFGLTSITIPNSVTSIGYRAFYYCYGLTSITIGNSVTSIEYAAFQGCSGLTSIAIPDSVTSIGYSAFQGCSNCLIYDFSNHTSVPNLVSTNAFNNTNPNKKIIVPDALYDQWKAANNWKSSTNGIVDAITKASEA